MLLVQVAIFMASRTLAKNQPFWQSTLEPVQFCPTYPRDFNALHIEGTRPPLVGHAALLPLSENAYTHAHQNRTEKSAFSRLVLALPQSICSQAEALGGNRKEKSPIRRLPSRGNTSPVHNF